MPKKSAEQGAISFGRPGNKVKIGIVGMPNVGKSSLFNLLTGICVPAENYPFCTIDPSNAVVPVPDPRFDFLCEKWKPKSEVPAVLTVTDIAGLVKGAAEGKGLGNAFLSNIQAVDAIYHNVRAFKKKSVEHVEGTVDPVRDIEIIRNELIAKDIQMMKTTVDLVQKKMRKSKDKTVKEDLATAVCALTNLEDGLEIRAKKNWTSKDIIFLNTLQLLTAKPVIYLVNITLKNFQKQQNKWLKPINAWVAKNDPGALVIPFSVAFEEEYASLQDDAAKKAYLKDHKVPSMLPRIITHGYKALGLQRYFTVGADEVAAWTIKAGLNARQAAGVIHTDFTKTFVKAEIYNYAAFKEHGTEQAVCAAGKKRSRGADYIMDDGDIVFFLCGAGKSKKK